MSCDAVLSEACFLLRNATGGPAAVVELVRRDLIRSSFDLNREAAAVQRLLARYRSMQMSLADACLVRMSEVRADCMVLTVDSDFRIYRRHGRQAIPLISPL